MKTKELVIELDGSVEDWRRFLEEFERREIEMAEAAKREIDELERGVAELGRRLRELKEATD